MKHVIHPPINEEIIRYVILYKLKTGIAEQMGNVLRVPGNKVVDTDYVVAFVDKPIAQMRTEEPRPTCDDGYEFLCHRK